MFHERTHDYPIKTYPSRKKIPANNLTMPLNQSWYRAYSSRIDTQGLVYYGCEIFETLCAEECDLFFTIEV